MTDIKQFDCDVPEYKDIEEPSISDMDPTRTVTFENVRIQFAHPQLVRENYKHQKKYIEQLKKERKNHRTTSISPVQKKSIAKKIIKKISDSLKFMRSGNGNGQSFNNSAEKEMIPVTQPTEFADDLFWWLKNYADNPPSNCQGKFILLYNRQIHHISDTEEDCLKVVKNSGLEKKHYVIMAVGVQSKCEVFEIPI